MTYSCTNCTKIIIELIREVYGDLDSYPFIDLDHTTEETIETVMALPGCLVGFTLYPTKMSIERVMPLMDEYADQDGNTAPRDWKGGFQYWMWHDLFSRIKPELSIPEDQIHFPSTANVNDYSRTIEDLGGADVCYGGIGWSGHIAFFEPHLGVEFGDDIDAYLKAGTRIVDLHPITICQNTLYADAGCLRVWPRRSSARVPKIKRLAFRLVDREVIATLSRSVFGSGGLSPRRTPGPGRSPTRRGREPPPRPLGPPT